MKAIRRLYEYFDFKGIKPTRLEKEIGLSNGYLGSQLRRNADIGSGALEKIVNYCRDLNLEWVVCNRGEMINSTIVYSEPKQEKKEAVASVQEPVDNEMLVDKLIMLSAENGALSNKNETLEKEVEELRRQLATATREKKTKEPPTYSVAAEPELKAKKGQKQ